MSAAVTDADRATASVDTRAPQHAEPGGPHAIDRLAPIGLAAFSVAVIAAFWVPALFHGLMTDELLSAWVSSDGLGDAVDRAQTYQGNSPVYFVALWAWRLVAGSSEVLLRLPSLVCVVAAAWQLSRLGIEIDRGRRVTGLVAGFVLVADTEVTLAATTARPYALLLLAVVVSARALIHFLHSGSRRAGVLWILAAAASLSMSPFAALALFAHLVALFGAARGRRIVPAGSADPPVDAKVWQRRLPALGALGACAVLPLVPQVLSLAGRREEIVTAWLPGGADLVQELAPLSLVAALVLGLACGAWRDRAAARDPAIRFVLAWSLGTVLLCWVVSHLTGTSIWVERYRVAAVPGFALLIGMAVGRIPHRGARALACGLLVALSLWSASELAGLNRHGWREAVEWARGETAGEAVTIALDSDLVELRNLDLLDDPAWLEYLSGPVEHYGLPGRIVLLPTGSSDATRAHQQQLLAELASGDDTVVLISTVLFRGPPDHLGAARATMGPGGWSETAGPLVGQHQAVVFRR